MRIINWPEEREIGPLIALCTISNYENDTKRHTWEHNFLHEDNINVIWWIKYNRNIIYYPGKMKWIYTVIEGAKKNYSYI